MKPTLLQRSAGRWALLAGGCVVGAVSAPASAQQTLYSQPRQAESIAFVSRTEPGGLSYTNRRVADGFVLPAGGRMTRLRFWGGDQSAAATPDLGNVVRFNIRLFVDAGEVPGQLVYEATVPIALAAPQMLSDLVGTLGAPMYQFEVAFAEPVPIFRGQFYWLSIGAELAAEPDGTNEAWTWCSSLYGDGSICQDRFDGLGFLNRGLSARNTAFEIVGAGVCPSDWDADDDTDSDDILAFFIAWDRGEGDFDGDEDSDSDDVVQFFGAWDEGC